MEYIDTLFIIQFDNLISMTWLEFKNSLVYLESDNLVLNFREGGLLILNNLKCKKEKTSLSFHSLAFIN